MAKANPSPELSCNNTVVKFVIPENEVEALKKRVEKIAGKEPVIYMELPLEDKMVELTVITARLTPGETQELDKLQKEIANVQAYKAGTSKTTVELDIFED